MDGVDISACTQQAAHVLGVARVGCATQGGVDIAISGDIVYKDYMQFSLTMNHMVIDGAPGARFLQTLKDIIENFELVCIAGC